MPFSLGRALPVVCDYGLLEVDDRMCIFSDVQVFFT